MARPMTACPRLLSRSPAANGTAPLLWPERQGLCGSHAMTMTANKKVCCAIYTRVSTEAGLDQDFNSLDAQYDAAQSYIRSQAHAGWTLIRTRYDDGGFSGGSTDRPALQQLIADIKAHKIKVVVFFCRSARR